MPLRLGPVRYLLAILLALAAVRPAAGDVIASTLRADAGASAARLILAWASPTSASLLVDGRTARLRLSRPVTADLGPARAALSGWLTDLRRDGRSGELVIGLAAGVHATLAAQSAGTYVLTLTRGFAGSDVTSAGNQPRNRTPDRQAKASPDLPALASISPATGPTPAEEKAPAPALRFAWSHPVAAAIFEHAGVVWTVFGARRRDLADGDHGLGTLEGWNELPALERDDLVAFRFRAPAGGAIALRAARQGATWLLEPAASPDPAGPAPEPRQHDGRLTFHATGKLVALTDPETGDELHLLLPDDPALRQPQHLAFVDLELLPTAAGLAWRELADGIVATRRRNDLELSRSGGLRLAQPAPLATSAPTETDPGRSGRQRSSRRDAVRTARLRRTRRRRSTRRPTRRDVPPACRARRGCGPQGPGQAGPPLRRRRPRRRGAGSSRRHEGHEWSARRLAGSGPKALRAAAEVLLGRTDRAADLLTGLPGPPDADTALWRAAAEAGLGRWEPAAEALNRAGRAWATYPPRLRLRLGVSAATILAHTGRVDDALAALRELAALPLSTTERARLSLLKGTVQARAGRSREAKDTLATALRDGDLSTRVAAAFALTQLPAARRGETVDALGELTRQRLLWRGHPDEATMLAALADVQRQHGKAADALATWRVALARTRDGTAAAEFTERMCDTLAAALSAEETGDAVTAYALYRSYPDLTAKLGGAAAKALADRLAGAGLTEAANTLLARATPDGVASCGHVPAVAAPPQAASKPDNPPEHPLRPDPQGTLAAMLRASAPLRGNTPDAVAAAAANAAALRSGLDALRASPPGSGRAEQAG